MKRSCIATLLAAPLLMLMTPLSALASPLDPSHLPAEAKWVVHVDLEAIVQTPLAEQIRQNRPHIVKQVRRWFQNRYGIEPREDLKSVTMFSDTYQAHTGTMILKANYDREKLAGELKNKPGVKTDTAQDHTLYTFSKPKMRGDASKEDASKKDASEDAAADDASSEQTMTIVLLDEETAIFSSSPERAKAAIQLLEGGGSSLKENSPLLADRIEGAMIYGAAVDLQSIEQRDGIFPVLRQHERIVWIVGQDSGETYDHLTLVATNNEVAEQMKTALEGAVAFGKVWAADSENLTKVVEGAEITVNGNTVERKWRGNSEVILGALEEVRDRLQQRLQDAGR